MAPVAPCGQLLRSTGVCGHGVPMDPQITTLLSGQEGVASTSQLRALGISRYVVRRLAAAKELVQLPRGIIVDPQVWQQTAPWDRHALRARGLMLGRPGPAESGVALSHQSALSLRGVSLYGVDDRVHIVRTDGRRSRSTDFVQCHAPVESELVHDWEGMRLTLPEVAVLQTAATYGVESGLVSADSCLRLKLVTREQLQETVDRGGFGNGTPAARLVARQASASAESPGESRCRWLFAVLGLPTPTVQAIIRDRDGAFVARVDFLFERERTIVEFDGRVKYTDTQVLFEEKQREDALRALGYTVVRLVWADLQHPQRVRARIAAAFQLARATRVS